MNLADYEMLLVAPKRIVDRCQLTADGEYRLTAPKSGWYQLHLAKLGETAAFTAHTHSRRLDAGDTIVERFLITKA